MIEMKYQTSGDALLQKVGDESVILDLRAGTYFGLDPIGSRVWMALASGIGLEPLLEELAHEYAVDPAILRQDVESLIAQLIDARLVSGPPGAPPT